MTLFCDYYAPAATVPNIGPLLFYEVSLFSGKNPLYSIDFMF